MITPLPGITTTKPGSRDDPVPGRGADVVDEEATIGRLGGGGLPRPHAPVARRCCAASGATTSATRRRTGRGSRAATSPATAAKRDDDGDFWLLGRIDDVMNVSGHRISTTEVEHALVSHPAVAEISANRLLPYRLHHATGAENALHRADGSIRELWSCFWAHSFPTGSGFRFCRKRREANPKRSNVPGQHRSNGLCRSCHGVPLEVGKRTCCPRGRSTGQIFRKSTDICRRGKENR